MNKLKKSITVRFFSIEAENSFFSEFVSNYQANQNNDNQTRIINIRNKKHLLKASNFIRQSDSDVFPVTVVRE